MHITLAGKGGVGKSMITSLIAQAMQETGRPFIAFDTDPVNQTLTSIEGIGALEVEMLREEDLNLEVVDDVIGKIIDQNMNFVIDTGASGFVPLNRYLLRNDIAGMVVGSGKRFVVHTVIVGGPSALEVMTGVADLIDQFPASTEFVLWLNPHFGPTGAFEDGPWWASNAARFTGVIRLPVLHPESQKSVQRMMAEHLTFAEARKEDSGFSLMQRLRLANVWAPIQKQIISVV